MRRAIIMPASTNPHITQAELDYRRERIVADFPRTSGLFHLKWPVGLLSPQRRRPRYRPAARPSPHHATSS
jgi:hypothetical protein